MATLSVVQAQRAVARDAAREIHEAAREKREEEREKREQELYATLKK